MDRLEIFKEKRKPFEQVRALPTDFDVAKIEVGEDRRIKGYAIVWGEKNSHDEIVLKGATLNSLNARGVGSTRNPIQFLYQHRTDEPIAKIDVLEEDDYGLYFEATIIKTQAGDDLIEKINAGVLRQLSYGFSYIWDKTEYDEEQDAYILREIKLWEISIVTFSSDESAQLRNLDFSTFQKIELIKEIDIDSIRSLVKLSKLKKENNNQEKVENNKVTFI